MHLAGCVMKPDPTTERVSDPVVTTPETQIMQGNSIKEPELPSTQEDAMTHIMITVGAQTFPAILHNNPTANAFSALLPMTIDMEELNGNEKYHYLWDGLPTNAKVPNKIHAGDLMLFGSECVVLFYEDFSTSYSYTPLGYIENPESLKEALGRGDVTVTFELIN